MACGQVLAGDTSGHSSVVTSYGSCASGMVGPEVVYRLEAPYFLRELVISLGATADLRVFVFPEGQPSECFAMVDKTQAAVLPDVAPGTYYLAVDGPTAGSYLISVRCQPAVAAQGARGPVR